MSVSSTILTEVGANLAQPSVEEQKLYNRLVLRAKHLALDGYLPEALSLYRRALAIYAAPSLQRKIERIEAHLAEQDGKDEPLPASSDPCSGQTPRRTARAVSRPSALPAHVAAAKERESSEGTDYGDHGAAGSSSPATSRIRTPAAGSRGSIAPARSVATVVDDDDDGRRRQRYAQLIADAREAIEQRDLEGALSLYKEAQSIRPAEKIARRIERIENYMEEAAAAEDNNQEEEDERPQRGTVPREQESRVETKGRAAREESDDIEQDGNGDMVLLGDELYLHEELVSKLYRHQKEGVLWLWSLYKQRKGGILADDMGLGKTVQVIAFLSGLFDAEDSQRILIVMPVSLIVNWQKEFDRWAPGIPLYTYHGQSQRERERILLRVQRRGGVLLTSYGIVVANWETLAERNGKALLWDCVILDEGHKIKNPTKTSKGVHGIGARCRIVMTGTPVQNNLSEMWALFDFTHHGMLLGSRKTFKEQYENPITRAREKCATRNEKVLGQEMAESLKRIISPYFLRRTKAEIKAPSTAEAVDGRHTAAMPALTKKNDFIVWLYLSDIQKQIYGDFLSLDSIKQLLMSTKSPLTALTVLKKLCDHPRLLSIKACCELGLDGVEMASGLDQSAEQSAATQIRSVKDAVLVEESGKMVFLVQLLDRLRAEGHRTLVFSQSRKMLDIIEKVMMHRGYKIIRLDGSIKDLHERDERVQKFQHNRTYNLFLLTTQVGGIGLTLTAASRVVIFDPSWNPATDSQAVDRAFRIGQKQNVVIYRFITCGTVEEKIYRRQVFKDSITMQTTGASKNPMRYFTRLELRDLFQLDCTDASETQQQLERMHSAQRATDSTLDDHIAYLRTCAMFGISDHDLMFTVEENDEGEADAAKCDDVYVQKRVEKAHELITAEAELQGRMNAAVGKYVPQQFATKQKVKGGEKKQKGFNEEEPLVSTQLEEVPSIEQLGRRVADIQLDQSMPDQEDGNLSDCAATAYHDESEGEVVVIDDDDECGIDDALPSVPYCKDSSIQDVTVTAVDSTVPAGSVSSPASGSPSPSSSIAPAFSDQRDVMDGNVSTSFRHFSDIPVGAAVESTPEVSDDSPAADAAEGSRNSHMVVGSLPPSSPLDRCRAAVESFATDGDQDDGTATCSSPAASFVADPTTAEPSPISHGSKRSRSRGDCVSPQLSLSSSNGAHDKEVADDVVGGEAVLDELLEISLPIMDFTRDRASPCNDNSYSRRKKLNRRSSYLPAVTRVRQTTDSSKPDSDEDCSLSEEESRLDAVGDAKHRSDLSCDSAEAIVEYGANSNAGLLLDDDPVDDDLVIPKVPSRKKKAVALESDDEDVCAYDEARTATPLDLKQLTSSGRTPAAESQQAVSGFDGPGRRRISSSKAGSMVGFTDEAARQPDIDSHEIAGTAVKKSCQNIQRDAADSSSTGAAAFEHSQLPAVDVDGNGTSASGLSVDDDQGLSNDSEDAIDVADEWGTAEKEAVDDEEGEEAVTEKEEEEEDDDFVHENDDYMLAAVDEEEAEEKDGDEQEDEHGVGTVEGAEDAHGEEAEKNNGTESEEVDEESCETGSQEEDHDETESEDDLSLEFDSSDEESHSDSEESQQRHHLRKQAKQYYGNGDYRNSLKCLLKSLHRGSSERLQVLAMRLKHKIAN